MLRKPWTRKPPQLSCVRPKKHVRQKNTLMFRCCLGPMTCCMLLSTVTHHINLVLYPVVLHGKRLLTEDGQQTPSESLTQGSVFEELRKSPVCVL